MGTFCLTTSWLSYTFCINGPLWGESTSHMWIRTDSWCILHKPDASDILVYTDAVAGFPTEWDRKWYLTSTCSMYWLVLYLTYWGRDEIVSILQTTFSNAFSWMKICEFCLRFHWSLFLRFLLRIFHHWFRWWLGAKQAPSHYLNQWWFVYWCMYASHGLNELMI